MEFLSFFDAFFQTALDSAHRNIKIVIVFEEYLKNMDITEFVSNLFIFLKTCVKPESLPEDQQEACKTLAELLPLGRQLIVIIKEERVADRWRRRSVAAYQEYKAAADSREDDESGPTETISSR